MQRVTRRRFIAGTGAAGVAGLAGCSGGNGNGGSTDTESGGDSDGGSSGTTAGSSDGGLTSVRILLPEGTIHYPMYEAATDAGVFEDEGIDLTVDYAPFGAQVQSLTGGEVDVNMVSMMPYVSNYLKGEDLVTFGWNGCLQCINGLYTRASSDYQSTADLEGQRIGVWSWGSSTVQSYQAVVAEESGLRLRQDFETTTAAPPALLGLLTDEQVDGVINVSGLTITMEAQPDTYRRLSQLNAMWRERAGYTLPLTAWFTYSDWYENNTETAAGLLRGAEAATTHWRENTASILEEYGETASVDTQAKIDVVDEWANDGQVFRGGWESGYTDANWDFINLMNEYEFVSEVPSQDELLRNPL
ncbi:ABC transporter substrate-binding protein [Halobellus rubicundus]|uniref:ABC transporter substrate-binding protein n=1 Tax=Halobellus rubicundus TaxID=2996466 RepID=A0ABD5MAL7_9EURY